MVAKACSIARYTARDECAGLADVADMARDVPDLHLYHPWELAPEEAIELARTCEAAGRAVFQRTVHVTSWILLAICVGLMGLVALAPDTVPWFGWRWLGDDPEPVRELTLRLMPYVVFVCLSAIFSGALQVRGERVPVGSGQAKHADSTLAALLPEPGRGGNHLIIAENQGCSPGQAREDLLHAGIEA